MSATRIVFPAGPRSSSCARRSRRAAPHSSVLAALLGLLVCSLLLLRASPARAQYGGLGLVGVVVLVGGSSLAAGSTITDIGIGYHLATTDSVPGKWSKTGLVFSSIQSTLGGSLLGLTLDNASSSGFDAPFFMALSSAYLVHGLGSMAVSIYGMTRRPPPPARRFTVPPRPAPPAWSLAGVSPLVASTEGRAAPGLAMSFRW